MRLEFVMVFAVIFLIKANQIKTKYVKKKYSDDFNAEPDATSNLT